MTHHSKIQRAAPFVLPQRPVTPEVERAIAQLSMMLRAWHMEHSVEPMPRNSNTTHVDLASGQSGVPGGAA